MMTFRKYINGVNIGAFKSLDEPGCVKFRGNIKDERRRVKIHVDLPEAQAARVGGLLGKRHIRNGRVPLGLPPDGIAAKPAPRPIDFTKERRVKKSILLPSVESRFTVS